MAPETSTLPEELTEVFALPLTDTSLEPLTFTVLEDTFASAGTVEKLLLPDTDVVESDPEIVTFFPLTVIVPSLFMEIELSPVLKVMLEPELIEIFPAPSIDMEQFLASEIVMLPLASSKEMVLPERVVMLFVLFPEPPPLPDFP